MRRIGVVISMLTMALVACVPESRPVEAAVVAVAPPEQQRQQVQVVSAEPPAITYTTASSPRGSPLNGVDVSAARQLYCNGTCSWAGAQGCDQADADVFCKLVTGRASAYATHYEKGLALEEGGFACPQPSYGRTIGSWPEIGVQDIRWQDDSIRANHGSGEVVYDVDCADR